MAIDASELRGIGSVMASSAARSRALVSAAVKKGAQNIKESIRTDLAGSSTPAFRRISIGYELRTVGVTGVAADIGPRTGGANELANIAFFGTARGGGTHRFYEHAEAELPELERRISRVGEEALG